MNAGGAESLRARLVDPTASGARERPARDADRARRPGVSRPPPGRGDHPAPPSRPRSAPAHRPRRGGRAPTQSVFLKAKSECCSELSFMLAARSECIFPAFEKRRSTPADVAGSRRAAPRDIIPNSADFTRIPPEYSLLRSDLGSSRLSRASGAENAARVSRVARFRASTLSSSLLDCSSQCLKANAASAARRTSDFPFESSFARFASLTSCLYGVVARTGKKVGVPLALDLGLARHRQRNDEERVSREVARSRCEEREGRNFAA